MQQLGVFRPKSSRRRSFWRGSSSWSFSSSSKTVSDWLMHISGVLLHLQQLCIYTSSSSPDKLTLNATLEKRPAYLLGPHSVFSIALVLWSTRNTSASGWERLTWTRTACLCWPLKKTSLTREHPPTGTVNITY